MHRSLSTLRRLIPSSVLLIVLGFILSRSLLGQHAPWLFEWLRGGGMGWLSLAAQIGLALFVLCVGMHFDKRAVWKNLSDSRFRTVTISSLILPGIAGFVFGYFLFLRHPEYAAKAGIWSFGFVNAIIFATAAVPVLCAILKGLGLRVLESYRDTVIIAMIGDILLWNALGLLGTDSGVGALKATIGLVIIIGLGFTVMTRVLESCEAWVMNQEEQGRISSQGKHVMFSLLAIATLGLCAFSTNVIGAHILPGAFLAGLIIPDQMKTVLLYGVAHNKKDADGHLQRGGWIDCVAKVLMIVFFLLPGLRFEGDLWQPSVWQLGVLYSVLATASKMTSVFFPALLVAKVSVKRAMKMSFFLNTRGTMEIVAVTELYKLGLLSPEVFVAVIIMTIICTALTVPGVYMVWWRFPEERDVPAPELQRA